MRVVKETFEQGCKITIFAWNNRYIIKLENGFFEQTFKIDQSDIDDEQEIMKLIDAEFIQQAQTRFGHMGQSLYEARQRLTP